MALAKNFQDLIIWQRGHNLALAIYRVTDSFPDSEKFGLTNQLRRAAVSIPSNIAEGFERNSSKDFSHFLVISRGSLAEIKAQLLLAKDLLYISPEDCQNLVSEADEVHKMLNKFRKSLESNELVH